MFRFENSQMFLWLWIIPALWVVVFWGARIQSQKMAQGLGSRLSPFLTRSVSPRRRRWKLILQSCAIFFFVLALARPQIGESKQEVRSEGIELILAVDVSESMMTEDVKPNRLDQAKVDLSRLMDLMPGNKTGVLAFAGSAAVLSPLTNDPAAVKMYLEALSPQSVSTQGTCFQCALETAADAFERGGVSNDESVKVTRVVLIASDGEDHEADAIKTAKALAEKGILAYTLAYGTEKGGSIPVRDGMGYLRGYKKDHSGQTILSQVHGEALQELASAGKGQFLFASSGGDHIKSLANELSALEKKSFATSVATQYDERFQWFLTIGILFALADLLLGERRNRFRLWRGRFEVPNA